MAIELTPRSRFIATNYWPLPTTWTTHLDIQRIYRNALFREIPKARLLGEQNRHREWVEEVQQTQTRTSFGEAAARYVGDLQRVLGVQDTQVPATQRDKIADDAAYARLVAQMDREAVAARDEEFARTLQHDDNDGPPALIEFPRPNTPTSFNAPILWEDDEDALKRAIAASLAIDTEMPDLVDDTSSAWQAVQEDNDAAEATDMVSRMDDPEPSDWFQRLAEQDQIAADYKVAQRSNDGYEDDIDIDVPPPSARPARTNSPTEDAAKMDPKGAS